jgi:hypothetical protein
LELIPGLLKSLKIRALSLLAEESCIGEKAIDINLLASTVLGIWVLQTCNSQQTINENGNIK